MLAVVVLLPIAIMFAACLLERFEARAVSADPPRRASRTDLRAPQTSPTPLLRLVPRASDPTTGTPIGLDAPTADLRRAS